MTTAPAPHEDTLCLVVACDEAGGIGRQGGLPWHLPVDLAHFRRITVGEHALERLAQTRAQGLPQSQALPEPERTLTVMGRTTWEGLPERFRPLPWRSCLVLSRHGTHLPGGRVVPTLDHALALHRAEARPGPLFVLGGAQVYAAALEHPACAVVERTLVPGRFDCDAFFPPFPRPGWHLERVREEPDGALRLRFERWRRGAAIP